MAEEKKVEKKASLIADLFGGLTGKANKHIKERKQKLDDAIAGMTGDTKAANGEERAGYSKKWVE